MTYDAAVEGHILNIIQNNEIVEQGDLRAILRERGYDVPQATLSRRLRKLKIAKVSGLYKVINFNQPHLPLILNVQISKMGLIILHTHPGQANSLAYFLDKKYVSYTPNTNNSGIIGTIAGDDTVLVIIKDIDFLDRVLVSLYEDFPYLANNEQSIL